MSLVQLRGLTVRFPRRPAPSLDGIDLDIAPGERVALVGPSGCGKSLVGAALLGLLPHSARQQAQAMSFNGQDLRNMSEDARRRLRGAGMALVTQHSGTALNPVRRVGSQVVEALARVKNLRRQEAEWRAANWLDRLDLAEPQRLLRAYPHELSGGQRQRILLALALACEPKLLIADEPTNALDPTTQALVLDQLYRLCAGTHTALLLIGHDLAQAAQACDRIAVLSAGKLVEQGETADVFGAPRHEQTRALLAAHRAFRRRPEDAPLKAQSAQPSLSLAPDDART